MKQEKNTNIFIDGSGADPNGVAGLAWLCEGQRPHVEWGYGWTNNEAEYRAVLSAVKALPDRTTATISCDSQLVIRQLRREWAVLEPHLWELHAEIETAVFNKALRIHWRWISGTTEK